MESFRGINYLMHWTGGTINSAFKKKSSLCSDVGAFSCVDVPSDKEFALATMNPPPLDKRPSLIDRIVELKTIQIGAHHQAYNRRTVRIGTLRKLEQLRECYRGHSSEAFVLLDVIMPQTERHVGVLEVIPLPRQRATQADPGEEFVPSLDLVDLVMQSIVVPTEESDIAVLQELGVLDVPVEERRQNVADMITDEVEGMLMSMAEQSAGRSTQPSITKGGRFTPEIANDLLERLGLDVYSASRVFRMLHNELLDFFLTSTRQRDWGTITAENGKIRLQVFKRAFAKLNYSKLLNDNKWTTF